MSTQAAPAPMPDQGQRKETPPLTDSYRKAHKSYVLVSGLLASWELIGITLDTKDKWGIELKSPSAVPLILFTLLLYSGYKMTIEWLQCEVGRRHNAVARVDYWVAHGLALAAVTIGLVQYLSHIRIADVLLSEASREIAVNLWTGAIVGGLGTLLARYRKSRGSRWWQSAVAIVLIAIVSIVLLVFQNSLMLGIVFITGILFGIATIYVGSLVGRIRMKRIQKGF